MAIALRGFERRDFLRAGFLGLGGLTLADLLRMRAQAAKAGVATKATSCILVWLGGGPSHLDTYDLKPDAPAEYRGIYRPIASNVPGIDVCELLRRHAQLADRFTLIRSCSHEFSGHQDGIQHVLTGRPAVLTNGGTITSVHPELGTIVKRVRPHGASGLPNYVALSHRLGFIGPAYLGQQYDPFVAPGNPNELGFQVPDLALASDSIARLDDRRELLRAFDRIRRDVDQSGGMGAIDSYHQEALRLLTTDEARSAFDLSRGDPRERDRYGRCRAGQSLYLARRLVEAGVAFVSVELSNYSEAGVDGGWDDHSTSCDIYDRMNRRLPVFDQALTALIEDLYERGLDQDVFVLAMGEFGRTPRIDTKEGRPGRDHWPYAMSILVSGGGMRMGQVIGSTDSKAERPQTRPLGPADILATLYRFLGIDPRQELVDFTGRPLAILPGGEPIRELLG